MTIRELEDKASQLLYDIRAYETPSRDISDLSIQFAIEVLEELNQIWVGDSKMIHVNEVQNKIQELKRILK